MRTYRHATFAAGKKRHIISVTILDYFRVKPCEANMYPECVIKVNLVSAAPDERDDDENEPAEDVADVAEDVSKVLQIDGRYLV